MTEKDYRKEGEEMEKKKKKKYSRTDKVILGIGFTILGLFVLSIAIPIIYVVLVVSSLPLLVMYPFFQKYFDKGIMVGSVKG